VAGFETENGLFCLEAWIVISDALRVSQTADLFLNYGVLPLFSEIRTSFPFERFGALRLCVEVTLIPLRERFPRIARTMRHHEMPAHNLETRIITGDALYLVGFLRRQAVRIRSKTRLGFREFGKFGVAVFFRSEHAPYRPNRQPIHPTVLR
jgi:hypothetical protein